MKYFYRMVKIKSNALNKIRVIAMTGIVMDHFLQASGGTILANTGLYMGGGVSDGVLCFVCLSVWDEMG